MNVKSNDKLPKFTAHPPWDKVKHILIAFLHQEITPLQAIEKIIASGHNVSLIYERDLDGYALLGEKICSVYDGKKGEVDIAFYFFTRRGIFKPSIKEAVIFYLWPKEDYEDETIFISHTGSFYLKTRLNQIL